jgi:hypothetical protein
MHELAEVHETPLSEGCEPPGGVGTVCTAQLVPFQTSASGCTTELESV